jgi:hypothetical protein
MVEAVDSMAVEAADSTAVEAFTEEGSPAEATWLIAADTPTPDIMAEATAATTVAIEAATMAGAATTVAMAVMVMEAVVGTAAVVGMVAMDGTVMAGAGAGVGAGVGRIGIGVGDIPMATTVTLITTIILTIRITIIPATHILMTRTAILRKTRTGDHKLLHRTRTDRQDPGDLL